MRDRILLAAAALSLGLAAHANATIKVYNFNLDGPSEPTISPGLGTSSVTVDDVANTMRVQFSFSGLLGTTTAAHIHSATAIPLTGTAGVATPTPFFPGFPTGVTAGSYDNTFDMTLSTSYNASFISGHGATVASARAFLFASLDNGTSYLNIHTTAFPGGEIRGFVVPTPGVGAALASLGLLAARRRR